MILTHLQFELLIENWHLKLFQIILILLLQKASIAKLYNSLEIWAQAMSGAGAVPFCEELALKQGKVMIQFSNCHFVAIYLLYILITVREIQLYNV